MKKFKKMMALVIAMVMIVSTMSMAPFAATGDLAYDENVTITNLEAGDTVNLYKIFERNTTTGKWQLTTNFNVDSIKNLQSVKDIIDNKKVTLSKEDLEAFATQAKKVSPDKTKENAPATYTEAVDVGMYMALVEPKTAGILYNPMVVSADYVTDTPNTNSIDASTAMMGNTTVAKKEKVTVEKTANDITHNTNDYVQFTVTTTIPAYSKSYVNPKFNVSDKLSTGLTGVVDGTHAFEVTAGDVTFTGTPSNGFTTFELVFDSAKIAELVAPQAVTIKYWAQVTSEAPWQVNEEANEVTVKYSNNPKNDSDVDELYDETKHYTFDIDGTLFGGGSNKTSEVVKVGVDKDGNWIEEKKQLTDETWHSALAGAKFALYTDKVEDADHLYKNKQYPEGCKDIETDENGLISIKGLDEGTYYLKETSAPNGYIKDDAWHTVNISATYTDKEYTKTINGKEVKYTVKTLDSYTITVDGAGQRYTNTLNATASVETVTRADGSAAEIRNTKGVELPSTGGMGTTIFYVIGAILVLGAGILLVTRRRMSAN